MRGVWVLAGALGAALLVALAVGAVPMGPGDVLRGLLGADARHGPVLLGLRLPRALTAALVGGGLALAGVGLQAVLRNPLAEPALLGVSTGAAAAVAALLVLVGDAGIAVGPWALVAAAFGGALAAVGCVRRIARSAQRDPLGHGALLVLAGVAVNALAGAILGLLLAHASDPALRSITFWTLGSLNGVGWPGVLLLTVAFGVAGGLLRRDARALDVLQLGAPEAQAAGVAVARLERRVVAASALLAGAGVALCGVIGFVGLVAPHLVRLVLGPGHARLVPASALFGATLLVIADTAARSVMAPVELPVGVLTALCGAPVFVWLLVRRGGVA